MCVGSKTGNDSLQGSVDGKVSWYDIEKCETVWVDKKKVEQATARIQAFVKSRRYEIEAEIEAFGSTDLPVGKRNPYRK